MPTTAQEVQVYIAIAELAIDLIKQLFKDKDYPYAAAYSRIINGVAASQGVTLLDGSGKAEWVAANNIFVAQLNQALKASGQYDKPGVTIKAVCWGFIAPDRPGGWEGGYFASDGNCAFGDNPRFQNTGTVATAIARAMEIVDEELIDNPQTEPIFRPGTDAPTSEGDTGRAIADALADVSGATTRILNELERSVTSSLDALTAVGNGLLGQISGVIFSGIDGILTTIRNSANRSTTHINTLMDGAISSSTALHSILESQLFDLIQTILIGENQVHSQRRDILDQSALQFMDNANLVVSTLGFLFDDRLDDIVQEQKGFLDTLGNSLTDILTSILDQILREAIRQQDPTGVLTDIINAILRKMGRDEIGLEVYTTPTKVLEILKVLIPELAKVIRNDPNEEDRLEEWFFDWARIFGESAESCRTVWKSNRPGSDFWADVLQTITGLISAIMFPLLMAQARGMYCLQLWSQDNPYLFLQPPDAALAHFRGHLSEGDATLMIQSAGYTEGEGKMLIDSARALPNPTELLSSWLRGFIDGDDLHTALAGHGYADKWIGNYKKLAFYIPPVQDLITMMVREAFNPEIVKRFQQDKDFPPEFLEWSLKQGVSEFWAHKYWQAHWQLPSLQMGFEMLHRREILDSDIDLLMKAQDVMPFWRRPLKAISYNPLTRVDVRRMHKIGTLTEAEVKDAYLDLGYNNANAQKMLDFTIKYNESDDTLFDEQLEGITRSTIIGFYKDGFLKRPVAFALLVALGINPLAVELFLDGADLDLEREERKARINLVLDRAKSGDVNFIDAQALLAGLDLTTLERDKAIGVLIRDNAKRTTLPSKSDLDKFLAADMITEAEYKDTLGRLGYSPKWQDMYFQMT